MCDSWIRSMRCALSTFYYTAMQQKGDIHKSVDVIVGYHDASYIYLLMDSVIQEISAKHVVHVVRNDSANFKRVG